MDINVSELGGDTFRVAVSDGGSATTHDVTVTALAVSQFGGGSSAEQLVRASFALLLDREPKESILARFDLPVIGRYFPDYEWKIGRYLERS